jgi:hypothetical protein
MTRSLPVALARRSLRGVVAAALVLASAACAEGPALVVSLQILNSGGLDLDDVTGFVVRFGENEAKVARNDNTQTALAFDDPPEGTVDVVVFACTTPNAACKVEDAAFVGCQTAELLPSTQELPVFVFLHELPADGVSFPPECAGILPEPTP